jgi:hypothetical protein
MTEAGTTPQEDKVTQWYEFSGRSKRKCRPSEVGINRSACDYLQRLKLTCPRWGVWGPEGDSEFVLLLRRSGLLARGPLQGASMEGTG